MSKNMNDQKKLAKYKAKFSGINNDPNKQQVYLSKIQEYSSKLRYLGQFGGADTADETALKAKFTELKAKIPTVTGISTAVNKLKTESAAAVVEHNTLIKNFTDEIKRLHTEKNKALANLKTAHDLQIETLTKKIAELEAKILVLDAKIKQLETPSAIDPSIEENKKKITTLEKEKAALEAEKVSWTDAKNAMELKISALETKYNAYKALTETQIRELEKELNTLKSASDGITTVLGAIILPDNTNYKKFPQIMYDLAVEEFVDAIKLIQANIKVPSNVVDVIKEIVVRLKESKKSVDEIKTDLKTKLNDQSKNTYVDQYVKQ